MAGFLGAAHATSYQHELIRSGIPTRADRLGAVTTPNLYVPDLSEWQGSVDWQALIHGGHPVAIIRAHNGSRADHDFQHNREQAHAHGIRALGLYAYLIAGVDPAHQAAEFVATVGTLRAGEWPILDYEAGGLHSTEIHAWISHVSQALHGSAPWLYAGEYIYRTQHLDQVSGVPAIRTWIAAYGSHEPVEGHTLWQYSSHGHVPGVTGNVDLSVFHGTADQLVAMVHGPTPAPPPVHHPKPGPTAHPSHPYPHGIHPGGTSPSARSLQTALKKTGWLASSVMESDHYGPQTQAAVAGFNRKHNLNSVGVSSDSAIGPHGWALLMTLAYGRS
jgi:GH25 family lysozyme M1 (1,4-beta-N-acetylmuramidase)